jgi:hypothetical protein
MTDVGCAELTNLRQAKSAADAAKKRKLAVSARKEPRFADSSLPLHHDGSHSKDYSRTQTYLKHTDKQLLTEHLHVIEIIKKKVKLTR